MQFEIPKERPSIIKVIGIGGGGSNAVNYMYRLGIKGVDFLVCNTDHQALEISPVPHRIQLGPSLTEGRGAGAIPEVGKNAAIENIEEIRQLLRENTKMVFITAGMGGGTGTGAAPIIAGVAREMGILTVAIVTIPFAFEGRKRKAQADAGIEELKKNVDTLLVICNEKLREIHGNLKLTDAFGHADNILAIAAKSIAEIITNTLHINVDFADIQTVMKESGVAIMGSAEAEGDDRALIAVKQALDSPLLNDNEIEGARYILLNITSGDLEVSMDEVGDITDYIQIQAGQTAEVIMGVGTDITLGNKINVTIIATGFKTKDQLVNMPSKPQAKIIYNLNDQLKSEPAPVIEAPVVPVAVTPEPQPEPVAVTPALPNEPYLKVIPEPVPAPVIPPVVQHEEPTQRIVHYLHEEEELMIANTPVAETITEPQSEIVNTPVIENEPSFVFEIRNNIPVSTVNNIPVEKAPEPTTSIQVPPVQKINEEKIQEDDPFQRAKERIYQLKAMSMKFNTPTGLNDLEKEPAYKRRNIQLENVPSSDSTPVSRFTLTGDADNKPEIKSNNTFLHDRVD